MAPPLRRWHFRCADGTPTAPMAPPLRRWHPHRGDRTPAAAMAPPLRRWYKPHMGFSSNRDRAVSREEVIAGLAESGYARLSAAALSSVLSLDFAQLNALRGSWDSLPPDEYLLDGGRYRSRRHSCFVQSFAPKAFTAAAHRAHWQSTTYNALHGGIERWFEPVETRVSHAPVWQRMLESLGALFAQARPVERWHIEAHQFRIDTANGIGRPTPEGAHRDGVDFVAVILIDRCNVKGGETRVFDANGPMGIRFTMQEPWAALLMDDARVVHETTPIQPDGAPAFRDTLVLTYRASGFQSRDAP